MSANKRQKFSDAIPVLPAVLEPWGGQEAALASIFASTDFHRLERALKRARGFALYFIRCNLPVYRRALMARLRATINRPVVEVKLLYDDNLLSYIAKAANRSPLEALLFISGLERLLPSHDESRRHLTLETLNWQRGAFARMHRPLIFWVPEYLVPLLAENAPDFWDWHSGLYEFDTPATMREASFHAMIQGGSREAWNLSSQEKRERMVLLRSLLEEYHGDSTTEISARGRTAQKLGDLHQSVGDYQNALKYFHLALQAYETTKDRAGMAAVCNNIGDIHRARGDYDTALRWYMRDLEITETLGDRAGMASSYNNLGAIQYARGDYDAARQWFQKSVEIQKALDDRAGLTTSYNNIGLIDSARGDYDAALQWHQKSVKIREALGDRAGMAISYNNIGAVHRARGDYAAALQWYEKSVEINEALGNRPALAITFHNMGFIAEAQQDWPTALAYFTRSRTLYQQIGLEKDVKEADELIAAIKEKMSEAK